MRSPIRFGLILMFALCAPAAVAHAHGDLHASADAISATEIEIRWQWYEFDPAHPDDHPEWIGYDLLRREPGQCSPWVRLNAAIIPREPGVTHAGTIVDAPPAPLVTWEYQLVPVNLAREPVVMIGGSCEPPCVPHVWESLPKLAGPVTVGRVGMDLGWAVYIEPCEGSCWYSFYVAEEMADQLRPYVGTSDVFRFFGDEYFGGFEGSALFLDRFEPASCVTTPARRSTWGRLKTHHR